VVSAIGHEQDTPLLDYVADLRASTPTDAAKRIVPDVSEELSKIGQYRDRATRCITGWLDRETSWLQAARSRPALANPVREIDRQAEQVDAIIARARTSLDGRLHRAEDDIKHTRARLLALSPATTLRRGYAIVQREDGAVIRESADVKAGDRLTIRLAEDQLSAVAE
jgi:exodeoxyribonuclease VII large subunit